MYMENLSKNTPAWRFQVWASFALATAMMLVGIYHLPVDWWMRGYMVMGLVFTIGSCFGLSKTIRDDYEVEKTTKSIHNAKSETIIREYKES